jgi:hypothetical protein
MVDWPGLLKFSLSYSDGTKKSEFKEMEQDKKKWLEEAIDYYSNDEVRQMQKIL